MSQTALTVGTEYTDRKISGTGTEADPWIIGSDPTDTDDNMLQNFLDAVSTVDAYIKLVRDIDGSLSEKYSEGISHYISIGAYKTCGESSDGKNVAVKNLLIEADNVFYCSPRYAETYTIEHIDFLNIYHKGADRPVYAGGNGRYIFNYCNVSIFRNCMASSAQFAYWGGSSGYITFDHCSIYYKAINYTVADTTGHYCTIFTPTFTKCQIIYDGPVYTGYPVLNNTDSSYVGVRLYIAYQCNVNGNTISLQNSGQYMYFMIHSATYIDDNYTMAVFTAGSSAPETLVLVALSDDVSKDHCSITQSTNFIEVTEAQLKDKDYLYSINVLP